MKVDDGTSYRDYRKTVAARRDAAGEYVDLFGEVDAAGVASGRQKRSSEGSMDGPRISRLDDPRSVTLRFA
jgi:hypothetical protein